MVRDYAMPKLAMAMNEGTINEWFFTEGDYVEKGAELACIETEKVAYDVEAPDSGYLHIIVAAGETVGCDVLLAQFADTPEELASLQAKPVIAAGSVVEEPGPEGVGSAVPTPERGAGGRIKASPLARKLAVQNNLTLEQLTGSGPGGRIVKRDIIAALDRKPLKKGEPAGSQVLARVPMQGSRAAIAARMVNSLQSAAQLASSWEADITDLLDVRQRLVDREAELGTRVSFNALLIKAIVGAISQVPIANSAIEGDEIVIYESVHMGIAVALPGESEYDSRLLVPVLRDVERLSVVEIDRRMKSLIDKARTGNLGADELTGSTITLSSTAGIAPPGLSTAPILNLPNALIVGPSTPIERPVVLNGEIVPRSLLPISATFDHRVLDGEPFARFAKALNDRLENPELLLA